MTLYKWMPVIYTDKLPPTVGGRLVFGLFAKIRPEYRDKNDYGIHEHEYMHFKQTWRLLWFGHIFLTMFSKTYRFASEVEAFAKQLECIAPENKVRMLNHYAKFIATHRRYKLNVTIDQAREALKYRSGIHV